MELVDSLLNPKVHIPMYASLLSFNAILLQRIATKFLSNILCNI